MSRAADRVAACATMADVRKHIDRLDHALVPLLVERCGYVAQAARIKPQASHVRDEARIEAIVQRVRAHAAAEGGVPDVLEAIYRSLIEASIAFEQREFDHLAAQGHKKGDAS